MSCLLLDVVCVSKQLTSKKKKDPTSSSLNSPLDPAHHDSAPHDSAPDILGPSDSNNSDGSDVEVEDAWDADSHSVQPVVRATSVRTTSKMSALVSKEVRALAPFRNLN